MRFRTFSCATTVATRPALATACPNAPARGKYPEAAIFSFPPMCSGAALVLMMYRSGRGGAGELITALKYGLAQPHAPGQLDPVQVFAAGGVTDAFASWLTAVSTLSVICAAPEFTRSTPP